MPPNHTVPPLHAPAEPNFDRVARLYHWAEYLALGPLLQQTRTALLDRLSGCRQALLFGDGDGRFLAQLLAHNPHLRATAVDTSSAMLRLLQGRCRRTCSTSSVRLITRRADALNVPIPPETDLVVTHFFLDCLTQDQVNALAEKVAAAAQPGALWLVSDFEIPGTPILQTAARLYIRSLYLAFRLLTGLRVQHLPNPQVALAAAGFQRLVRHRKLFGLLYSELWELHEPRRAASPYQHNPALPGLIHQAMDLIDTTSKVPEEGASSSALTESPADPQPNPEPAVPSLSEPDPGVFHHEPGQPPASGS